VNRSRRRIPVPALLLRIGLAGALASVIFITVNAGLFDPMSVRSYILRFGRWAPVIWIILYVPATFIPYATSIMTVAAGLAFGSVPGALLTYGVTSFASFLPFSVSRWLGRSWVEYAIGRSRVAPYVARLNRHSFVVFLYLRLLPTIPYELQNHIAGVSRIRKRDFFLASVLGNGPATFVMAFFGDSLASTGSIHFWVATILYAGMLVLPLLVVRQRARRKRAADSGR